MKIRQITVMSLFQPGIAEARRQCGERVPILRLVEVFAVDWLGRQRASVRARYGRVEDGDGPGPGTARWKRDQLFGLPPDPSPDHRRLLGCDAQIVPNGARQAPRRHERTRGRR